MSDEEMKKSPEDFVQFSYTFPKKADADHHVHISAWLGKKTHMTFGFNDDAGDGTAAMTELISKIPQMLKYVRAEVEVHRETAELEAEIAALLDPDGGEEK